MPFRGDRLRRLREHKQWNQKDVANWMEVTAQAYYKWEKGKDQPSVERLIQLCEIFSCTADYLLGLVEKPYEHSEMEKLDKSERNLLLMFRARRKRKIPRAVLHFLEDLEIIDENDVTPTLPESTSNNN